MKPKGYGEVFSIVLFFTVISNFIAQIPYYFHQYYQTHHLAPSLVGLSLMSLVLVWFISAYLLLRKQKKSGYYLMLTFLAIEFLFYLQTQISQLLISHRILLRVYRPDSLLLFIVFAIGYANFIAAAYFIGYLLRNRKQFVHM